MAQLCSILWGLLSTLAVAVSAAWSWALDNFPGLSSWWMKLPAGLKAVLYAVFTVIIGGALWAIGRYAIPCPGWPGDMDIWMMILAAVASWFTGGYFHEKAKTKVETRTGTGAQ